MQYISSRGLCPAVSFTDCLLAGLAPDGGLYVPQQFPKLDIDALKGLDYPSLAASILSHFVGSDLKTILPDLCAKSYGCDIFRHKAVVPLQQLASDLWLLELYHGPTIAFKDVALQLLARLMDEALAQKNQRMLLIGATSGDTGSAAIEACRHARHVDIVILYPHGRVSDIQRRQMTSTGAANVHVLAIDGDFDDCQAMVKTLFQQPPSANIRLGAVNSINWMRIAAQAVYYGATCMALNATPSDPLNFVVPTGNFGNVYAAWVAKQMGFPIQQLVVASNRNDILTRTINSGVMEKQAVAPSLSPSMDIQISSNFERLLFELYGRDSVQLQQIMQSFQNQGTVALAPEKLAKLQEEFSGFCVDDEQTLQSIRQTYNETGVITDPHTAVGLAAYRHALLKGQRSVALACAHPAKFPDTIEKAIGVRPPLPDHLGDLHQRSEHVTRLPADVALVSQYINTHINK
ncbi:MAG: threonine synthase [Alphaproteobacteria bacterium]